ncbi:MAG: hypothetical protein RI922_380 [Bacteroidota bacterium]|jgi:hypothetical protein
MKKYIAFAILAIAIISCKKEEVEVTATITISSPSENDTIPFGQAVHLTGTVTGSAEMHGYTVSYTNVTTGSTLLSQVHDVHAASYALDETWTNNVTDTAVVKLLVDVEKDHEGNMEMKEVTVVCLPQ